MLALKIILIILLILFLLTLLSVRLNLSYDEGVLTIKAGYGPVTLTLYPEKEETPRQKRRREKKEARAESAKQKAELKQAKRSAKSSTTAHQSKSPEETTPEGAPPKEVDPTEAEKSAATKDIPPETKPKPADRLQTLTDNYRMMVDLLKSSKRALGIFCRHFIISRVFLLLRISGDNAHQTAVGYANHVSAVTNIIAYLSLLFKVKIKKIDIQPDFLSYESRYNIRFTARIRLIWVLIVAINILVIIIKNTDLLKRKGGRRHEPTKVS